MARSSLLKSKTILSILILLVFLHTPKTLSNEDDDDEVHFLDNPIPNFMSRSRFLISMIRKGARCDPTSNNICNGVSANNGTSLLYCCKNHCRNVIRDENNCGVCGNKCKFGQNCCDKKCVNLSSDANHCGKCNNKCDSGVPCSYGSCGYA